MLVGISDVVDDCYWNRSVDRNHLVARSDNVIVDLDLHLHLDNDVDFNHVDVYHYDGPRRVGHRNAADRRDCAGSRHHRLSNG